jgi:hypothetical protein
VQRTELDAVARSPCRAPAGSCCRAA